MTEILDGITYFPNCEAVMMAGDDPHDDNPFLDPIRVDRHLVAPWGINNDLPSLVREHIELSEIMSSNLEFNRNVMFGLGPRLVRRTPDGQYEEVTSGKEYDFFERNDIAMFLLETMTDMAYFANSFTQLIPDRSFKEIYTIRNAEAVFSRWGLDKRGAIISHLYSNQWPDGNPAPDNIASSPVIDEFDAVADTQRLMTARRRRMIYGSYMPSPGRPYYSRPNWYSLFASGWYALGVSIPALKRTILKNHLGVKFIIYISPKYFRQREREEGIDEKDTTAVKQLREREVQKFRDFLSGEENMSKAMVAFKEMVPTSSSGAEEKYIEIVPVKNDIEGGEFLVDLDSVTNMTCYAMQIHPSLIGAVPGKSSGSLSGTDKRELFLMKQALLKPVVNRCLKPLEVVRRINKWDPDITIQLPEYIFTTLDQNKSGKQESTTDEI